MNFPQWVGVENKKNNDSLSPFNPMNQGDIYRIYRSRKMPIEKEKQERKKKKIWIEHKPN